MAAFRKSWMDRKGNSGPGWDPSYLGSQITKDGKTYQGFYQHVNGSLGDEEGGVEQAIRADMTPKLQNAQDDQAIYEILQNAADCEASACAIFYDDDMLVALNNGASFTTRDIEGILNSFQGTKSNKSGGANCEKIGRYGIGFKLIHRLAGRQEGVDELIRELRGPVLFSWDSRAEFEALLAGGGDLEPSSEGARLFKILLTCFPAYPGEIVRGLDMEPAVPFPIEELNELRGYLQRNRARFADLNLDRGTLFFLRLGKDKRKLLDKTMAAITGGIAYSMHFLKKLSTVVIQDHHVHQTEALLIEQRINPGDAQFTAIQPEFHECPVHTVFGYLDGARKELKELPNVLQFFPMSNERHGLGYFVHSSGFRKVTDRTKLDTSSSGNQVILKALADKVVAHMDRLRVEDRNTYIDLFSAILVSDHSVTNDNRHVLEALDAPLLTYIRSQVPVAGGGCDVGTNVRINKTALDIPLQRLGLKVQWADSALIELKLSADLGRTLKIEGWSLADVLKAEGLDRTALASWVYHLQRPDYGVFLQELLTIKDVLRSTWFSSVPFIRTGSTCLSLLELARNEDAFSPVLLDDVFELLGGAEGAVLREDLELALVALMAPKDRTWSGSSPYLHGLSDRAAAEILKQGQAIALDLDKEDEVIRFLDRLDTLGIATSVVKKLLFRYEGHEIDYHQYRSGKAIVLKLEGYRTIRIPLAEIFPDSDESKNAAMCEALTKLVDRSMVSEGLKDLFKPKEDDGEASIQELDIIWKRFLPEWDKSRYNIFGAAGLALVLAYAAAHKDPTVLKRVSVHCRKENCDLHPLSEDLMVAGGSFIDPCYLLAEAYAEVKRYIRPAQGSLEYVIAGAGGCLLLKPGVDEQGLRLMGLKEDLDETTALELMEWLFKEWTKHPLAIKEVEWNNAFGFAKAVGFVPSEKVLAKKELLLEEELLPAWFRSWAATKEHKEFCMGLGIAGITHPVVQARTALLSGTGLELIDWSLLSPSQCQRTLAWLVTRGGPQVANTQVHEQAVKACAERANVPLRAVLTRDITEESPECDDPVHVQYRAGSDGEQDWEIRIYPGPIPVQYTFNSMPIAEMGMVPVWEHPENYVVFVQTGHDLGDALHELVTRYQEWCGGQFGREAYDAFIGAKRMFNRGQGLQNVESWSSLEKLCRDKNVTIEQLTRLVEHYDFTNMNDDDTDPSSSDASKKAQEEASIEARNLVRAHLEKEGFEFREGIGRFSVINGVYKGDIEYPLVVKSFILGSDYFRLNPNEWLQLNKPNSMCWVHRGGGRLEVLSIEGLFRENTHFHVKFRTDAFEMEHMVRFAQNFRFVRDVTFQLPAPGFTASQALEDYRFDRRSGSKLQEGPDSEDQL